MNRHGFDVISKRRTITIRASFDVEVPEDDWIGFLVDAPDIFSRSYIGYWARGMEAVDGYGKKGWLCWVHDNEKPPADEIVDDLSTAFFMGGTPLPERWFFLDRDLAIKAYVEGVKRYGEDWFENGDGVQYDVAIQMAVFGEVRYG